MIGSVLIIILFAFSIQFHLHSEFQPLLQSSGSDTLTAFSFFISSTRTIIGVRAVSLVLPVILITAIEMCAFNAESIPIRKSLSIQNVSWSKGFKYQDLYYFLFGLLKLPASFLAILSIGTYYLSTAASESVINLVKPAIEHLSSINIPNILFLAISVALGEFVGYWGHRLNHKIPQLWKIHEFHHSATEMCIFNTSRISALDGFSKILLVPVSAASTLLSGFFMVKCGVFGIIVYSLHMSLSKLNEYAGHSSLNIKYPWPINLVYLDPRDHWLHHSIAEEHYGKNYGVVLSIWDKLFGTYMQLPSSRYSDLKYGVMNSDYNKTFPLLELFCKPPILALQSFIRLFI